MPGFVSNSLEFEGIETGVIDLLPHPEEQQSNLVLACGFLAKLLNNKQVVRYLKQRQPEVLAKLETIVQTVSLEQ